MQRSFWHVYFTFFLLVFLVVSGTAYGFDIAVYFDARSPVEWRCMSQDTTFCWGEAPRHTALTNIGTQWEQQVFDWYAEMGVTHVITYYPFADDFQADFWHHLRGIKILNWSWPAEGFTYLEASKRSCLV